ncbi:glutamate synthase subunit beta [Halosquirtibacter xylanolyticus]|uniref:glutamate synthase subunit beta n=1 Tax=Halosquirtibacter xylanolyticus TaxID=3374599 RepID=UPI0037492171|nr:glutamate synthase subunit beta [Prolixibacteraceae bacterium]
MGNPKGFIEIERKEGGYRPVLERIYDFGEVEQTLNLRDRQLQASRCMDCGVPFCHWGCPVGSKMPEWQDAIYHGKHEEAYHILTTTNPFPEFTGRVCPAPCEKSCVLAIHDEAVTIRENEASVVERAFEEGYAVPKKPSSRSGKKVAVIGSGPAGLTSAYWLNQAGHEVTIFEKDSKFGGLLRYGIPDFKLNKNIIDRRLSVLKSEGIHFQANTEVGVDITHEELDQQYDAVLLACGAMKPRDLQVEGRDLKGVHFAMDFLSQQNKAIGGEAFDQEKISTKDKHVLVIGGGDTGSDCVGTSIRQKAKSVLQIEIMPKPTEQRVEDNPWPYWPNVLRTSSSHKEGCERRWSLSTKRFIGEGGAIKQVEVVQVEWQSKNGRYMPVEIEGSSEILDVDVVFLSMGFVSPIHKGLIDSLGVELDQRGNVSSTKNVTSLGKVFAAGDVTTGASLVVRAMRSGRDAAESIDAFLEK